MTNEQLYSLFIETITEIKTCIKRCNRIDEVLDEFDGFYHMTYSTLMPYEYMLLKWIKACMPEECDLDWIDFYLFEIACGEDYFDGCVTDENDNPIPLITPDDLWNLLMDNN